VLVSGLAVVALLAVALAGSGGGHGATAGAAGGGPARQAAPADARTAASSPAAAAEAALRPPPQPVPAAPGSQVPVPLALFESDPFLVAARGRYLLFTSGGPEPGAFHIPISTSADFVTWTPAADALPVLPQWASPGLTWAPDVHRFGSRWALYFTSAFAGITPETECVGSAFSDSPTGPYVAQPTPIVCQLDQGGTIDPRVFVDGDGTPWMLYKSEQNRGGADTPTKLWSQRLSADGMHLIGPPSLLMGPDRPWQGTIVEAPQMLRADGAYWVVYSANWFNNPTYAVGAARCLGPAGPCADVTPGPLLASNAQGEGPGEASVFADSAGIWMLYSPRRSLAPKPDWPPRPVYITRLGVGPSGPYLADGPLPQATDLLGLPLWATIP
jgi:hypothetical protein